ncbi:MAG: PHP domain-containing protein, partial [Bacteroidota bacterium]
MLNSHTYYSLRYGTLSPEQLVIEAKAVGMDTIVLTDINNTSCSFDFVSQCKKHDVKPILGIEFRKEHQLLYVAIAKNNQGFNELCAFLTEHSLEEKPLPNIAPAFKNAYIIYRSLPKPIEEFSNTEYFGIRPEEVNALFTSGLKAHQDRLVIFSPITFKDSDGYRCHQLLRCIDLNIVLSKLDKKSIAKKSEVFYPLEHLEKHFEQYPKLIQNTKDILEYCCIDMEYALTHNRQTFTGSKSGDFKLLSKLAYNGCNRRYGHDNTKALERTKKELKVIHQLGFSAYFLITWDIIRYAQTAGYYHVGRGSGANSIVAYCLHITDVDPLELDLYFERFINPHRTSPPDFDIDFSWDERDDVTDYVFKRYGKEHTALLATYSTFKGKSIIRELGKVFGLPKADIDL